MTVLEYMATHADELSQCKSREEVYEKIVRGGANASPEEFRAANEEMNFLYKVLEAIFEGGKMEEARKLYQTIKTVVDTKVPV